MDSELLVWSTDQSKGLEHSPQSIQETKENAKSMPFTSPRCGRPRIEEVHLVDGQSPRRSMSDSAHESQRQAGSTEPVAEIPAPRPGSRAEPVIKRKLASSSQHRKQKVNVWWTGMHANLSAQPQERSSKGQGLEVKEPSHLLPGAPPLGSRDPPGTSVALPEYTNPVFLL